MFWKPGIPGCAPKKPLALTRGIPGTPIMPGGSGFAMWPNVPGLQPGGSGSSTYVTWASSGIGAQWDGIGALRGLLGWLACLLARASCSHQEALLCHK
ncbi:MAG: hypothetical protein FRX49_02968 [Trebouxia sp. A1-2]|nr:MAG: hypothetical protein FRX49_02968 [Trebouxia sp. A1-2]